MKKAGGISFNAMCNLTKCDEKLVQMVLHEYSILYIDKESILNVCII